MNEIYERIRPKAARSARANSLPKIHKMQVTLLPKFRPIIDTTGPTHYKVGKFVINNFYRPLDQNRHTTCRNQSIRCFSKKDTNITLSMLSACILM